MSHEKSHGCPGNSKEPFSQPSYHSVEFSTPKELRRAAEFDTSVFSEIRSQFDGEAVSQPTVDTDEYDNLIRNGGRVIAYLDDNDEIIALCSIALNKDPEASEPILKNMEPDMAYMTVAAVRKDYRGKGFGSVMLDERIEIARRAGKTRAVTTVHRTNVASMRNLLRVGFLGVAQFDNYYNIEGEDGERVIMYYGDINDPNWAENSTDPSTTIIASHISASDHAPHYTPANTMIETVLKTISLENNYCIQNVTRGEDGIPDYHLVRFTNPEVASQIARLIFPYKSLGDAFLEKCGLSDERLSLADLILFKGAQHIDYIYNAQNSQERRPPTPFSATANHFFSEWLYEYQKFINTSIHKREYTEGFTPTFHRSNLTATMPVLTIIISSFLQAQEYALRNTLETPPLDDTPQAIVSMASITLYNEFLIAASLFENPGSYSAEHKQQAGDLHERLRPLVELVLAHMPDAPKESNDQSVYETHLTEYTEKIIPLYWKLHEKEPANQFKRMSAVQRLGVRAISILTGKYKDFL